MADEVMERFGDPSCGGSVGDDDGDPGGADDPSECETAECEPWWQRAGIGIMAALVVIGSALVPPSQPVRAEAPLGEPIPVGSRPFSVAVDPAANRAYVANGGSSSVSVIDTVTNTVIGLPIQVGTGPVAAVLNPATHRLYTANFGGDSVTVVDVAANAVVGTPIPVPSQPRAAAINLTTNRIYVSSIGTGGNNVTVVDGATNTVMGSPIAVGLDPEGVAVDPVTNRVYVANLGSDTVTVIDGTTNTIVGTPIQVGTQPDSIAVNPVTNRVYVVNGGGGNVTVIDGATNRTVGMPIPVGLAPRAIAVNPTTNQVLVANSVGNNVTVIDGAANAVVGLPVATGTGPVGIGIDPVTARAYVANVAAGSVTVLGIPLSTSPSRASPGAVVTATWSALFLPNGADFVGLFEPGAPNTAPLSRRFTNGTASAGGAGVVAGSVDVPVPPTLAAGGRFEARLIAGASGIRLAQTIDTAPTATADGYSVSMGGTLNVPAPGILANDADADGSSLQALVVTGPVHGTLALQPNGAFSYTPTATFSGPDSFTYHALDAAGLPATATVTLAVMAAPVGTNDAYSAASGAALNVPAPGVLGNDTDADSPSLQAVLGTNPAHGMLRLQPDGSFSYTPTAGFSGMDSFTYRASDQSSLSLPVMVTLSVTLERCVPRPRVQTAVATGGGTLQIQVQGTPLTTQEPDPVRSLRFGTLQNAKVTVNGQPIASGETFTAPAGSTAVAFSVERITPGQPTTVPFTVTDGCGEWQTFVGGGAGAGF
jgi:YVTN family beta-propeller protein